MAGKTERAERETLLVSGNNAVYGCHISGTLKTTVYLDEADYRALKAIARSRGCAPALLLREAVAEYTTRHGKRALPRSLGAFHSGQSDLGSRADELLEGMGLDRDRR